MAAQAHEQRYEGRRAHAAGDVFGGDGRHQKAVDLGGVVERHEAQVEGRQGEAAPGALAQHRQQPEADDGGQL